MDDELKKLMQNLTDAQNILKENQLLLQQKSNLTGKLQKAIEDEKAGIIDKSKRLLSDLDGEISNIRRDIDKKTQKVLFESEKISAGMNELIRELIKIDEINDRENRSDSKQEKAMQTASIIAFLVDKNHIRALLYPKGLRQYCIYSGFLFLVAALIALPVALLISGSIPLINDSVMRVPALLIIWSAEMYGYYRLRKFFKNNESYYRNKTQRHNGEIKELNRQKNEILLKINGNHADAILKVEEYKKALQENKSRIQELDREKEDKIRSIEMKKREMSNWRRISDEEFVSRAVEKITAEFEREISLIAVRIKENDDFLENECRVGPEFQNNETLTKLISYFRNERATSIKEALELYLQEKRSEEEKQAEIDFQNKQLQLQQRHLNELNRHLEIIANHESKSNSKAGREKYDKEKKT